MTDATGRNGAPTDDNDDAMIDTDAALDPLATAQAENAELKDRLLRTVADMENLKRRHEREANDARAYAIQRFARDLLGVHDNLARALQHTPAESGDPQAVKNFVLGVEMTEKTLADAFEKNGLKKLAPAAGDKFDPHVHQAMMEQPSDTVAAGAVVSTLQTGWELFGRVVRPAMVIVAAAGSGAQAGAYASASAEAGATVNTRA